MKRAPSGTLMRFMEQSLNIETDGCILWPHALTSCGYPVITIQRKTHRVIRLICERIYGPPLVKQVAAHSCGVPSCINKRHLRWATQVENSADMVLHGTRLHGERSPHAKLTDQQVLEIRQDTDKPHMIAKKYNVRQELITRIQSGETWSHLPLNTEAKNAWRSTVCIEDGCSKKAVARRMCVNHYNAKNFTRRTA